MQPKNGKLSFVLEHITPAKASAYLELNTRNRPPRASHIEYLRLELEAGQWEVNGETIKFASDGTLIDGQHRLMACVEANKPLKTYVVRGLPESAFNTIDVGMPRTFGDYLARDGEKNYANLASCVRYYRAITGPKSRRLTGRLGVVDAYEVLGKNPRLRQSVKVATSVGIHRICPTGLAAAVHYAGKKAGQAQKADKFLEQLALGDKLRRTQPVYHLRERFLDLRSRGEGWHRETLARYYVLAWRLTAANKRVDGLHLTENDSYKISKGK